MPVMGLCIAVILSNTIIGYGLPVINRVLGYRVKKPVMLAMTARLWQIVIVILANIYRVLVCIIYFVDKPWHIASMPVYTIST